MPMMQLKLNKYMTNMLRKGLSSIVVLIAFSTFSQFSLNSVHPDFTPKKKWLDVSVKKTGPYFGYQRGKYNVGELGVEGQYKQIKRSKSITHAGQVGFNYNFTRRSEEHTSELQSHHDLVCRLLLEKKK